MKTQPPRFARFRAGAFTPLEMPLAGPALGLITLWPWVRGLGADAARVRRRWLWASVALSLATLAFVAWALYAPLFELAPAIR